MSKQQLAFIALDILDFYAFDLQPSPYAPIAVSGLVFDNAGEASFRSTSSTMGGDFLKSANFASVN